ncbi:MAG TPA: head decoration protein [Luteimonas sp.]|nr:head decoration protein [Luteimonas sp.]
MNQTFTEGVRAGGYIADEVSVNLSRKQGVMASGSGVVLAGTVVGIVTATGKYAPLDTEAGTGIEDAAGVLFDTVDATSADQDCVVSAALTAVNASEIIWPDGISDGDKNTAIGQLEARQITVLAADPINSGS